MKVGVYYMLVIDILLSLLLNIFLLKTLINFFIYKLNKLMLSQQSIILGFGVWGLGFGVWGLPSTYESCHQIGQILAQVLSDHEIFHEWN